MKENRRVRMTKNCLKQAMLELLSVHGKDKISITDVCNAADINRSTFYAYYNGLDELMSEIEDDFLEQIPLPFDQIDSDGQCLSELTKIFEYIKSNVNIVRVFMFRTNDDGFILKLTKYIYEHYKNTLQKPDSVEERYSIIYRISGAIGLIKNWITDGFPISTAEFARFTLMIAVPTA